MGREKAKMSWTFCRKRLVHAISDDGWLVETVVLRDKEDRLVHWMLRLLDKDSGYVRDR